MSTIIRHAWLGAALILGACSSRLHQAPPPWRPAASLQELMQDIIDPSADGAGAVIHVRGFLTKNGGPFGYAVTITLADGRSFQTGGAPNTPASDGAKVAPAAGY